jgi:hypothetical protein
MTEPISATAMLGIALASSLVSGGAMGASTFFGNKAQDKRDKKAEKLQRDQMAMTDRQHRDLLRQRKEEAEFNKIGSNLNNLASIGSLRSVIGKPTASQKLLS